MQRGSVVEPLLRKGNTMKLVQIITFALCLNVSLLRANDEDDQPWGRFGKQSVIGMSSALIAGGTAMTVFGVKKIYSAVSKSNADILVEFNTLENRRALHNNLFNGLSMIGIGTAITIMGYVTIIHGLAAETESLKNN